MKKILYVDMDDVLVEFKSALPKLSKKTLQQYEGKYYKAPGIFGLMDPMQDAVESFQSLSEKFETYILSTSPWENPSAWSDKLLWVKKYLGQAAHKRLILTHHKNLNVGDFLVDDRTHNGAGNFKGEHILFGSTEFPNWRAVVPYLDERAT